MSAAKLSTIIACTTANNLHPKAALLSAKEPTYCLILPCNQSLILQFILPRPFHHIIGNWDATVLQCSWQLQLSFFFSTIKQNTLIAVLTIHLYFHDWNFPIARTGSCYRSGSNAFFPAGCMLAPLIISNRPFFCNTPSRRGLWS